MDQGRCISSLNGEVECCSNFYLDSDVCKPCPPGTYGVNCSFMCPRLMYGDRCGYFCNCPPDQCDAAYGCVATTSTVSSKPTSVEVSVTISTHTYLTKRFGITESPFSTIRDSTLYIRDQTEPFPYRAIILGMGAVIAFFLVFSFIQICSKMRSKRKRNKSSEESGIYHEIPAADETVQQEITEHYNQVTEHSDISYIKRQENKIMQNTKNGVDPYRTLLHDDVKLEDFKPPISETYLQNMYLTVEETKKNETDFSSDSGSRKSYLELIKKEENHLYADVMENSNDSTSCTNIESDRDITIYSVDCENDDTLMRNRSPKDFSPQQDIYLKVI